MSINDRIIVLINLLEDGVKRSFSRNAGIPEGTLSSIIGSRKSDPSFSMIKRIVDAYPEVNVEWLVKEEGEPILKEAKKLSPLAKNPGMPDTNSLEKISSDQFLSKNLKLLRKRSKLTQEAFGKLFNVTRENIASYERGVEPKLSFLITVSDYFQIKMDDIAKLDLSQNK
ncbi:MAG: helix-turn-helix transcriptional regulator [Mangrovibacterium sp.]